IRPFERMINEGVLIIPTGPEKPNAEATANEPRFMAAFRRIVDEGVSTIPTGFASRRDPRSSEGLLAVLRCRSRASSVPDCGPSADEREIVFDSSPTVRYHLDVAFVIFSSRHTRLGSNLQRCVSNSAHLRKHAKMSRSTTRRSVLLQQTSMDDRKTRSIIRSECLVSLATTALMNRRRPLLRYRKPRA